MAKKISSWVLSLAWLFLLLFGGLVSPTIIWVFIALSACSCCLIPFWGRAAYIALAISLIFLIVAVWVECRQERGAHLARTKTLLATLKLASEMYTREYGVDPEGDIATVGRLLEGENPKGIPFIELASNSVNGEDQIIDAWKMPISLSRRDGRLIFSSAGPDTVFGTPDDIASEPNNGNPRTTGSRRTAR